MKKLCALACVWTVLVSPALAGQPAAAAKGNAPADSARSTAELYQEAVKLEAKLALTPAESLYREILRRSDPERDWLLRRNAQQGLRRTADLRIEFSLSEADLLKKVGQSYRGFKPEELLEWERRGWVLSRVADGKRGYSILNPTNLRFFATEIMARNESATKEYRKFARLFLDESASLDRLRAASRAPRQQVAPVPYVFTTKCLVHEADLPPGNLVRVWFPCPLLTPSIQNIRVLSVEPAGALRHAPDVEADVGIVYLEVPRPAKGDLAIELKVAFDAFHTDCVIDPDRIPPYDEKSEFYRRYTRSEQQMEQTEALVQLARSIVGRETNPLRKARKLYDWVCDHVKYNFVWRWRDATFTYGCASEEVRERRIGDCVIQSVFYAALCRSVGVPARVLNGPIFPPGMKNDHVWAEVYFPLAGWVPVDVTYSEVASMVPGLTDAERRCLRDFFFGRLDRWRFCTERNDLAQDLVPLKRSPRRHVTMFVRPELECGGEDVPKALLSWECQPEPGDAAPAGSSAAGNKQN